jgi:hypothetical protein
MSDLTADGIVRPEADAITAMSALVEAARQGSTELPARLNAVLANGDADAVELLGRAGQAAVSGEDFLFLL